VEATLTTGLQGGEVGIAAGGIAAAAAALLRKRRRGLSPKET
jgi:hypothetical protein